MEMSPSPRRLAGPLFFVGCVVIGLGLAMRLATDLPAGLALTVMAIGGAHAAAALVLARATITEALAGRRGRAGRNVALSTLLAVALAVVANLVAARTYFLADLTADRTFTLSPRTEAILADLERRNDGGSDDDDDEEDDGGRRRVRITLLDGGDPLLDRAADLLDTYASRTRAIELDRIDLEFEPMRAALFVQEFRDVPPEARAGAIAFASGANKRLVTPDELFTGTAEGTDGPGFRGEEAITSAILSVTEGRRKVVAFTIGHGEATFDSDRRFAVDIWASELRRLNVDVRSLELPTADRIPGDVDLVVIVNPSPEVPFSSRELRLLERWIDAGGSLMVLIEPLTPPQIREGLRHSLPDWLERFGFRLPTAEIVVDPAGATTAVPVEFLTGSFGDHETVRPLAATMLLFQIARPVIPALDNPKGFRPTTLVSSSPESWAETDLDEQGLARPELESTRDRRGPISLAAAAESDASGSRIVVVGDSVLGLDLREGIQAYPSRAFVLGATNWLLRREPLVSLPARPLDEGRRIELTREQRSRVLWLTAAGLPAAVLVLGLGVALRRRSDR